MKTLIIYESFHHGNTEKIARAIAAVLGGRLAHVREVTKDDLVSSDLVGFGSGVYFWQHHHRLLRLADDLPEHKGKKAFLFSTAGMPLPFLYHRPLRGKLKKKKWRVIAEFSCRGFDTVGPLALVGGIARRRPDEKDLDRARRFAEELKRIKEK